MHQCHPGRIHLAALPSAVGPRCTRRAGAAQVQRFLNAWIQGTDVVQYTPAGLAWSNARGSLRSTANAALIAVIYGRHINGARRERGL